jgi:hypothetical protein
VAVGVEKQSKRLRRADQEASADKRTNALLHHPSSYHVCVSCEEPDVRAVEAGTGAYGGALPLEQADEAGVACAADTLARVTCLVSCVRLQTRLGARQSRWRFALRVSCRRPRLPLPPTPPTPRRSVHMHSQPTLSSCDSSLAATRPSNPLFPPSNVLFKPLSKQRS